VNAVRENQHAFAKRLDERAVGVEFQNGRHVLNLIRRRIEAAVAAAALGDPDRLAVLVDVDGARRSPLAAVGKFEIVLDRVVRIRRVVHRRNWRRLIGGHTDIGRGQRRHRGTGQHDAGSNCCHHSSYCFAKVENLQNL